MKTFMLSSDTSCDQRVLLQPGGGEKTRSAKSRECGSIFERWCGRQNQRATRTTVFQYSVLHLNGVSGIKKLLWYYTAGQQGRNPRLPADGGSWVVSMLGPLRKLKSPCLTSFPRRLPPCCKTLFRASVRNSRKISQRKEKKKARIFFFFFK